MPTTVHPFEGFDIVVTPVEPGPIGRYLNWRPRPSVMIRFKRGHRLCKTDLVELAAICQRDYGVRFESVERDVDDLIKIVHVGIGMWTCAEQNIKDLSKHVLSAIGNRQPAQAVSA